MSSFLGTPSRVDQINQLSPGQNQVQNQLNSAAMGQPSSGAFGQASNYYQDLLSGNDNYNAMAAPEMRQFNEETMPGLAEQFAGMGAGGSFGGSFRSATAQAGAGLAERLASMRAGLRQQGAQGMMNIGQQSLVPHMQNMQVPSTPGMAHGLVNMAGSALSMFGGGALGALGSQAGMGIISSLMAKKEANQNNENNTGSMNTTNNPGSSSYNNGAWIV